MQAETLLSLPDGLVITGFHCTDMLVHLDIASVGPQAFCPICNCASTATHSSYQRTFHDVPCGGYAVQIQLTTRRFFCREAECTRQIFTERFPHFVLPRARMTQRFREALKALSIFTAHEAAVRLARLLHLPTSVTTVRRQFWQQALPTFPTPTKIGIDDFALRRGKTYGTLIVDLESHRIVDLLAERTTSVVECWLQAHPQVQVISRDRAGEYALAAARAAPQATQIADRFHLLKNAGECLERFIQRHPSLLHDALPSTLPRTARRASAERIAQAQRGPRRTVLYEQVQTLTRQGQSQRTIGQTLGIARGTVIRYQRAHEVPSAPPRERTRSFDPYLPYLRDQWEAGQHNVRILWKAIQAQGFTGSYHYLGRYLTQWRTSSGRTGRPPKAPILTPTVLPFRRHTISARRLRWLCCKDPADLQPQEVSKIASCYERCPELLTMQQHLTAFIALVCQRDRPQLDRWLHEAEQTALPDLHGFVQGIRRDYAAVASALEYDWSQGVVEGQVNRIKTIKRQLYGRATLPVLKQHLLLTGT